MRFHLGAVGPCPAFANISARASEDAFGVFSVSEFAYVAMCLLTSFVGHFQMC